MFKIVIWALLIIHMFFLPNAVISIYGFISKFGAGLFLLVQVIVLLDATHSWNDSWVAKDDQKWFVSLLAVSITCYIAEFAIPGLLFIWFNPSGHDCSLNVFFLVMTMVLALAFAVIAFAVIALHPQANGSLLPASVISCTVPMCVILVLQLNLEIMSAMVFTKTLKQSPQVHLFSACLQLFSQFYIPPFVPALPQLSYLLHLLPEQVKGNRFWNQKSSFFHLIFALASMYSAMLFSGWTSSESSDLIDVGWTSVWVRICTEWVTAGLYVWSLVAPLIFLDREFY